MSCACVLGKNNPGSSKSHTKALGLGWAVPGCARKVRRFCAGVEWPRTGAVEEARSRRSFVVAGKNFHFDSK